MRQEQGHWLACSCGQAESAVRPRWVTTYPYGFPQKATTSLQAPGLLVRSATLSVQSLALSSELIGTVGNQEFPISLYSTSIAETL